MKTPKPARKTLQPAIQALSAPAPNRRGDRNESQTVLRACEVLKVFRSLGEELSLTEVIERTDLPKTTVFRLLRTLIHGGLLERASSGVYRNRFGPVTARPFRGRLRRAGRFRFLPRGDAKCGNRRGARTHPPDYGQQPLLRARSPAQR